MFDAPAIAEALRTYVLSTAPVLALLLDANQCIVGANDKAREVLRSEAMGRPLAEQLLSFDRPPESAALIGQTEALHRLTLHTASGTPETLDFCFYPLGEATLALGSLDFQEQKKLRDEVLQLNRELNNLTRQLHQANAELSELNDLKNRFIGMAAHDLRRPVGVIMTYSELVLDEAGARLDDEQRGLLRSNLAAALGMQRIIDNFLDVSVIESGQLRLDRSRTSVAEILTGALPLVRLLAARKCVTLVVDDSDSDPSLCVDCAKLQQVLVNLLSNAIEHSRAGQHVWLSARRNDVGLVISVRDEGSGIPPEDQHRLFGAFVRAGTRKTAGERSVGLGLAIARVVVEAHGGKIWVESTPDHGSTFCFTLPADATLGEPPRPTTS